MDYNYNYNGLVNFGKIIIKSERILYYIPIIHTYTDMGTFGEVIYQETAQSEDGRKSKEERLNKMWTEIEKTIDGLNLSYEKVRLYQDGLPLCGKELEIVQEIANKKSRNYQLLLRLIEKGAILTGTESIELLTREYDIYHKLFINKGLLKTIEDNEYVKIELAEILKQRDEFIANRINTTLCYGETGVLFLGMLHSLKGLLEKDIKIIFLVNKHFDCL